MSKKTETIPFRMQMHINNRHLKHAFVDTLEKETLTNRDKKVLLNYYEILENYINELREKIKE